AAAVPLNAAPVTPRTAPVSANLATVRPVLVGLRWRPLMSVSVFLSVRTYEVSCRVRAEEVARPSCSVRSLPASPRGPLLAHRPGPPGKPHRSEPGGFLGDRLGPPFPVPLGSFVG